MCIDLASSESLTASHKKDSQEERLEFAQFLVINNCSDTSATFEMYENKFEFQLVAKDNQSNTTARLLRSGDPLKLYWYDIP